MANWAAIDFQDLHHNSAAPVTLALLAVNLDNLAHIAHVYGELASDCALDVVERLLRDAVGTGGMVARASDGALTAVVWAPEVLGHDISEAGCAAFVQGFGERVARTGVSFAGADLRVAVSGVWSLWRDVHEDPDLVAAGNELKSRLAALPFHGDPAQSGADWWQCYKADMVQASWLLSAMSDDRLLPVWQPVRSAHDEGAVLYHECLLRVLDEGQQVSAGPAIGALERLGLVGALDHHVMSCVLEELHRDPDVCLGANISAHSAVLGGWWTEIVPQLREAPSLASRLVVEITETVRFPDIGEAARLAAQLRKLGVRIALDDFGVGHASLRALLGLQPDIVKIDAFFLRRAATSERECATLHHLIGLAGSLVADVVVEGVETVEESERALRAGAVWQQGYHMGYPSVVRSRSHAPRQANVLALFDRPQAPWVAARRAAG